MKKNLSNLLQRGNLTPKQRYLLLIQNDIEKERTGKEILTKADEQALIGWQAKTPAEAREWNKYNEGWKLGGRVGIEAEFVYAETKAEHYRKNIMAIELTIYPFYRERLNALQALKKIKVVDINEAVAITKKQREQKLKDGINFDFAVHQFAFENLSDEIRKDILILDEEAEYEPSYLNDEETIADLFNGKDELTKEAKTKYAELVASRSYNKFAKEYQLHGAFAGLPIMDIAKKWAKDKGITPRQEDYERYEKMTGGILNKARRNGSKEIADKMNKEFIERPQEKKDEWLLEDSLKEILEDYTKENKTTIKRILKETLLKWLDNSLLIKKHTPLFNSKQKNTYSGDTKHQHDKLFKEWLKAKDKARTTLQKLIAKGDLKTKETGQDKTITGESLYNFKGDFKFIKRFKERVDRYDANAGLIYADDDKEHTGDNLDRELLIAKRDKDGKPAIVSLFGMSLKKIETGLQPHFFKETDKDGETYLEFNSESVKEAFTSAVANIKDGYAKLLAFQEILKKLNKIYEAETDHALKQRIGQVSEFIDDHNFFVENALEDLMGFGVGFGLYKKPLKTKESLLIEKDKIKPHAETITKWAEHFRGVFNDEF
jgi:hypothetical protein